jgi:hypothetical protein
MKNTITLDVDHHNKTRVEYFLNAVDEELEQIPFDAHHWLHVDNIVAGFKFRGTARNTLITVIFATSYFHANDIGTANSLQKIPNTKWTVNGDILFVVESVDEDIVSDILSLFAGRE